MTTMNAIAQAALKGIVSAMEDVMLSKALPGAVEAWASLYTKEVGKKATVFSIIAQSYVQAREAGDSDAEAELYSDMVELVNEELGLGPVPTPPAPKKAKKPATPPALNHLQKALEEAMVLQVRRLNTQKNTFQVAFQNGLALTVRAKDATEAIAKARQAFVELRKEELRLAYASKKAA